MEHLSNDHEDHPNEHENSHKLCDERGHLVLSLLESQRKLRQQHDQNFPMEGKPDAYMYMHLHVEYKSKSIHMKSGIFKTTMMY